MNLTKIKNRVKYFWQRHTNRFAVSDEDCWNVDGSILLFMVNILKHFKNMKRQGVANEYVEQANGDINAAVVLYENDLGNLVAKFEKILNDYEENIDSYKTEDVQEAFNHLTKMMKNLWD